MTHSPFLVIVEPEEQLHGDNDESAGLQVVADRRIPLGLASMVKCQNTLLSQA